MAITSKDLDFIDSINRVLTRYTNSISVDEYFLNSLLSKNKSPINIIENVFLSRIEKVIREGNTVDLSSICFAYSISFLSTNKGSALKFRKLSNSFKILHTLITGDKIVWTVSYTGDPRCSKCNYLKFAQLDMEEEAINPSCPIAECDLSNNICTGIPVFKEIRDDNGRIVMHNKNYKELIKLNINRDED